MEIHNDGDSRKRKLSEDVVSTTGDDTPFIKKPKITNQGIGWMWRHCHARWLSYTLKKPKITNQESAEYEDIVMLDDESYTRNAQGISHHIAQVLSTF